MRLAQNLGIRFTSPIRPSYSPGDIQGLRYSTPYDRRKSVNLASKRWKGWRMSLVKGIAKIDCAASGKFLSVLVVSRALFFNAYWPHLCATGHSECVFAVARVASSWASAFPRDTGECDAECRLRASAHST